MAQPNPWYRTYLGQVPADGVGGSRAIKVVAAFQAGPDPLNLSSGARIDLDLTQDAMLANMLFVQALYLDLADVAAAVSVSVIHIDTGFRVKAKGLTQGWYPFIAANTLKFTITGPSSLIGAQLPLFFTNTPADAMQWATA